MKTPRSFRLLFFVFLFLAACSQATLVESPLETKQQATLTPRAALDVQRIEIRVVEGVGEFYKSSTGERFVPRGVNYVDFYLAEHGNYEDRVMATNVYNPQRVRTAFQNLARYGYNTVRIFFDTCGGGPYCIGNPSGIGLNPAYLDNMVDLMHVAGEEGIYIIFTANSVPENGGYWPYFDQQINISDQRFGFADYRNADWLHPAGVEIKRRFWHDLMAGLTERSAPFEVVLGWQLTNELWLWKEAPPLSLSEGLVTISNEQTYDMSNADEKRQMVVDGVLFYVDEIAAIVKSYDPQGLVTVGFFAPQFPNSTGIGGDWYVDTAPLIEADAVDFWDFHAYYDTDLSVQQQAENFGMLGFEGKPVIMGETGSGHAIFPSAFTALSIGLLYIADSCAVGFDGWLNWGYYPWPEDLDGKPWTLLEEDELLLKAMSPLHQPDPCIVPPQPQTNVALGRAVQASSQLGSNPAAAAVDGSSNPWNAGNYPPQWIEITLDEPTTVQQVGMSIEQWPPGNTHHQVWAKLENQTQVLVAEFYGYTSIDGQLVYRLPIALNGVIAVRIRSLESPAWVAWREVEVVSAPEPSGEACVGQALGTLSMRRWPGSDEPQVSQLNAGQLIYLDGHSVTSDGTPWLRVGAGLWVTSHDMALSGDCESPLLSGEPLPRMAAVTFKVQAPEGSGPEVFMGGSFQHPGIPTWVPWSILLLPRAGFYEATVEMPVGQQIEYVYNLGGWERSERGAGCAQLPERTLLIEDTPMLVEDIISNWHGSDC
ncbi:MAG: hypothetical protein KIT08_06975 [Anaerolineales bacterium]|nr:MAG: hypothetical protein KIT08_06975 [Anaerolineales bacterium]